MKHLHLRNRRCKCRGNKGTKPTVVVFVASWCEVCREEMPTMVESFRAHQAHAVVFLGVDVYEDWETARAFREEFGMPFPLLVDAYGEVATRYASMVRRRRSSLIATESSATWSWADHSTARILIKR